MRFDTNWGVGGVPRHFLPRPEFSSTARSFTFDGSSCYRGDDLYRIVRTSLPIRAGVHAIGFEITLPTTGSFNTWQIFVGAVSAGAQSVVSSYGMLAVVLSVLDEGLAFTKY